MPRRICSRGATSLDKFFPASRGALTGRPWPSAIADIVVFTRSTTSWTDRRETHGFHQGCWKMRRSAMCCSTLRFVSRSFTPRISPNAACARTSRAPFGRAFPRTRSWPEVYGIRPPIVRSRAVFPLPAAPRATTRSPANARIDTERWVDPSPRGRQRRSPDLPQPPLPQLRAGVQTLRFRSVRRLRNRRWQARCLSPAPGSWVGLRLQLRHG